MKKEDRERDRERENGRQTVAGGTLTPVYATLRDAAINVHAVLPSYAEIYLR